MRYMVARFLEELDELKYRIYTSDMLRTMAMGMRIQSVPRYVELLDYKPQETRSGEEIAADVIQRCGLRLKL